LAKKAFVYDGSQWVDIAQSTADLSNYANITTTPISGFRNAIINGDFRVWQRGTSINLTASTNTYLADRFSVLMDSNAGTVNYSRQPFTAGNYISGNESLHFARISTGGNCNLALTQAIEGVETFAGKTITVSFWARTSVAKTFTVLVRQHFGSGGSANVDQSFSYTTSTSWQRFTFNVTLGSISGKTIGANSSLFLQPIQYAAHTGNFTYDIWGVQVEQGTIATPFEQRPIATELALCERYYVRFTAPTNSAVLAMGWQASTGASVFVIPLGTRMRIVPAPGGSGIVVSDETSYEATIFTLVIGSNGSDTKNISLTATHSTAGAQFRPASIRRSSGTAGFLDLNAEL
jgi:hypothetical protein